MEVPRPVFESELQLLACATTTPDLSCTCDQCGSLQQHWILNPLSSATSSQTLGLVLHLLTHNGNSSYHKFELQIQKKKHILQWIL